MECGQELVDRESIDRNAHAKSTPIFDFNRLLDEMRVGSSNLPYLDVCTVSVVHQCHLHSLFRSVYFAHSIVAAILSSKMQAVQCVLILYFLCETYIIEFNAAFYSCFLRGVLLHREGAPSCAYPFDQWFEL